MALAAIGHLTKTVYELVLRDRNGGSASALANVRIDQVLGKLSQVNERQIELAHQQTLILQRLELRQEEQSAALERIEQKLPKGVRR